MASNIWHAGLICVSPASWPDCGKVRSSWMRSGGGIGSSVKHCDITCMAGSSNHPFDSTPPETQSPVVPSRVTQRTAQPTAGFRMIDQVDVGLGCGAGRSRAARVYRDLDVVPVGFIDDSRDFVIGHGLHIAPGGTGDLDQIDAALALLAGLPDELIACVTEHTRRHCQVEA